MEQPQPILCLDELRTVEEIERTAKPPLMERAGAAAADLAMRLQSGHGLAPLVVAGPGNNGGDALVVARLLRERGLAPVLVFAGDAARLRGDARAAYDAWLAGGGQCLPDIPDDSHPSIAVDGLFGIGLARPIDGRYAALVERINALACPVLALDVPSGIDSETGRILGVAVRATHTASFIALKPGLLTLDGPDHCGEISSHDLGLEAPDSGGRAVAAGWFSDCLRPRRRNSHKGSYGAAGIIGGAPGMSGAALLAGRAALMLGAGRVYVGLLSPLAVDVGQAELMLRDPESVFTLADALAIGPGLGQSKAALALLRRAIDTELPLLLDADALNLLALHPVIVRRLARRSAPTLMTPHPAEAARLQGTTPAEIQADRRRAALDLAQRCNASVVLKGSGSIIALPDGRWLINTSGNPALATAGTGDLLTGMAVALLAQGWPPDRALPAAAHLHGAAADACVAAGIGPVGLTAGELLAEARAQFNTWIAAAHAG